ncbi:MAG: IclR family transcriptional regulator [Gammaproteobacteria bacterium]|nr:IclR family transcriptional regulator [Gammaproteobacteria bacterium]MCY4278200.1 IclR family transcriptional regulator [Gammaproteobacteria bacterium]
MRYSNTKSGNVTATPARRKTYSAPALEKGLSMLELLADEPAGLKLSDIARRLDRSVGEIFRMLAVLEQRGYVTSLNGTDTYRLTLKMFDLSHRYPPVKRLTSIAAPVMAQLAFGTGQSCHLSIYYEGKGHVVAQQDASSERIFSVRLGAQAPLLDSCSGHVLLAFADDEMRARMIAELPDGERPRTSELPRLVSKVRKQGFERVASRQIHGVEDIGFPVFDYTGVIVAALVMPFVSYLDSSHPVAIDEAFLRVKAAAETISSSMGI